MMELSTSSSLILLNIKKRERVDGKSIYGSSSFFNIQIIFKMHKVILKTKNNKKKLSFFMISLQKKGFCKNQRITYPWMKIKYFIIFNTVIFRTPKDIRLNCTVYFIMKNSNKHEIQQTAYN